MSLLTICKCSGVELTLIVMDISYCQNSVISKLPNTANGITSSLRVEGQIHKLMKKNKKDLFCTEAEQTHRHVGHMVTLLHLRLSGGQFRLEAGTSEEINELQ